MLHYRTEGYNGYAIKYSPFFDNRLACAASANFGLVGNGRLYILGLTAQGIVGEKWFDTQDGLFDTAWSEIHENQIAVASGDGSIKLFDIALNEFPVMQWQEHQKEVFSLSWNPIQKAQFASSSWDGTIKLWTPTSPVSLSTYRTNSCTYSTSFSPHHPNMLSCVSSDSTLRIFDTRSPSSPAGPGGMGGAPGAMPSVSIPVSPMAPSELLTHDWNKYRPDTIAVGGVDRVIRVFDVRAPGQPVSELRGHNYAVKKLCWSPHWAGVLSSGGYDMSVRIWDDGVLMDAFGTGQSAPGVGGPGSMGPPKVGRQLGVFERHSEFVAGLDWCMFGGQGWLASAGWDESVWVWDAKAVMRGVPVGMR